jgi:hypothetical protein
MVRSSYPSFQEATADRLQVELRAVELWMLAVVAQKPWSRSRYTTRVDEAA